jgi:hypothetical protein
MNDFVISRQYMERFLAGSLGISRISDDLWFDFNGAVFEPSGDERLRDVAATMLEAGPIVYDEFRLQFMRVASLSLGSRIEADRFLEVVRLPDVARVDAVQLQALIYFAAEAEELEVDDKLINEVYREIVFESERQNDSEVDCEASGSFDQISVVGVSGSGAPMADVTNDPEDMETLIFPGNAEVYSFSSKVGYGQPTRRRDRTVTLFFKRDGAQGRVEYSAAV